jgi:hypothetical protein
MTCVMDKSPITIAGSQTFVEAAFGPKISAIFVSCNRIVRILAQFRLMDRAGIQQTDTPGRFQVVFNLGDRRAALEMEINDAADPFRLTEIEHFDCPVPGK